MSQDIFSKLTAVNAGMDPQDVLTAERINTIQNILKMLWSGDNIQKSRHLRRRVLPGVGFTLVVDLENSPLQQLPALQVYDATSGGTLKIGVTFGTAGENAQNSPGDSVPKIEGTRIDATPTPHLTITSSVKVIYLEMDINDSNKVTNVTVSSATGDIPAESPTAFYVTLAAITVDTTGDTPFISSISNNLDGSFAYQRCAGANHLIAGI